MTPEEVRALLERKGALLSGHFRLSSGLHSDSFIQKFRIFEDPRAAETVGSALAGLLAPARPEVVVSAAAGGIIPGYVVARHLGARFIFVEKEGGVPVLRRGFSLRSGERVAVVEDVMTTGQSTREVVDVVTAAGAQVVGIGAVVVRGRVAFAQPLHALLEMPLADYEPQDCPLCRRGEPLQDPGSRRLG